MAPVRLPTAGRLLLALALLAAGCSGIAVHKAAKSSSLLGAGKASALVGDDLSPRSLQTLRRLDLEEVYRRKPADAAAQLHALALQDPQPEFLFVLAELSYLQGKRAERWDCAGSVGHYYLCAGYAYHYLFACADSGPTAPRSAGDSRSESPTIDAPLAPADPFDPRFRLACDLYNAGLSKCIAAAQRVGRLDPRHELRLPTADGGAFTLSVVHAGFPWKPEEFGPLLPCDDYEVEGLANRPPRLRPRRATHRASAPPTPRRRNTNTYPKNVSFPVTAFFRFDGGLAELGERRTGRLELYNPLTIQAIEVRGRSVPLETDLTTPLAYFLSDTNLSERRLRRLPAPDSLKSRYGIHMLEPYQPGKIPVLLVHGLLSSPLTWMPVFNDLRADPELRQHFQFWFYFYPTGDPYIATAADLRRNLEALRADLDPDHKDAALDRMVLVGHSMGGLISKLMTVDSGDDFWQLVSDRPFGDLTLRPDARDELRRIFFFQREPCVQRVIFLGTPHHGSRLSPSPAGRLADELVRLPQGLMSAVQDAAAENPGQATVRQLRKHPDERGPAGAGMRRPWSCWRRGRTRPACITTRLSA